VVIEPTNTPTELTEQTPPSMDKNPGIPPQYAHFTRVFSEEASHKFPPSRIWDHVIELKPGAPATLPFRLIFLSQPEIQELRKLL
jgi:hypothetical protein